MCCMLRHYITFALFFFKVGDYVKVEADRGEDLGIVTTIFPVAEAGRPLAATAGQKRGFGQFEKEHIIRAATEDEVRKQNSMYGTGVLLHHQIHGNMDMT